MIDAAVFGSSRPFAIASSVFSQRQRSSPVSKLKLPHGHKRTEVTNQPVPVTKFLKP